MAVILTAGISWADEVNNSSRIQNLEVDIADETATRIIVDNSLQDQIDNIELTPGPIGPIGPSGPQGIEGPPGSSGSTVPTSGYVSVPLMPVWEKINRAKKEVCYDSEEGIVHNMNDAYASTSVLWYGWMSAETDPNVYSKYLLPIQLPDGATITSFHILAYDNDPTFDGRVVFRRSHTAANETTYKITTANLYTSGYSNVPRTFSAGAIEPSLALIDNFRYSYSLEAKLGGGSDVVLMSAVVGYGYGVDPPGGGEDPPGGGDDNYSGIWNINESTWEVQCEGDTIGLETFTLEILHSDNDVTLYGPDGSAYPEQLVGNTLTVDAETDEGAGWFNLVITFTSTDSFTAEFVEFAYDGECFRRSDMTGSKQ